MNRIATLLPALALLALAACQKEADQVAPAPAAAPAPTVGAPAPAAGPALYRVTFEATWSAATHASFPAGGHFSSLTGLSHRAETPVFRDGEPASLGIKDVAELGNSAALRAEIEALRGSGAALGLLNGRDGTASPGTLTDTIRLDAAHSYLSVVTMIAPSPDWFAALESENLLGPDGQWVAQRRVPARSYDAGTDSGPTFTAPDEATLPAVAISPLRLPPAAGNAPAGPPVGTWLLERIK